MALKFFIITIIVATAHAGVVAPIAPVAYAANVINTEFDPNPQYTFGYDVQDAITGDSKSQVETRNNGIVQGQYSLIEADGTKRIVDYVADPINGFNAIVRKAPLVAPAIGAPVVAKVAAPLLTQAPVAFARYAPVAKYSAPIVAKYAAAPVFAKYAAAPLAYPAPLAAGPAVAKFASPLAAPAAYASPYVASPALAHSLPYSYATL